MPSPETIAALAFFGLVVILPLVNMLMKHQRHLAELMHRNVPGEAMPRIEALEREVRELRAESHARMLAEDDREALVRRQREVSSGSGG